MGSPNQPLPPLRGDPSHRNRLSWLSRPFHRTDTNPSTTYAVEAQQQQSNSEQSPSDGISSETNTTITPGSLYRRRRRPSLLRRIICRTRPGTKRNSALYFDEVEPHRGFSPPRHRQQPEWMRQLRDDGGDWVNGSEEYDDHRPIKEAGAETDVVVGGGEARERVRAVGEEASVSGSQQNDSVRGESSTKG